MPRLSIVIPCLGGAIEFEDTLVSVLQNRPAQSEVLVVHALPYDDPYGLQDEVRFIRASGKSSLVQLANLGVEAAESDIVHLLGCRVSVQEGWAEPALKQFHDEQVAAVSPLIVDAHDQRITAAGVRYGAGGQRKLVGRGLAMNSRKLPNLQAAGPSFDAGFYRREVLLAVGGWHEPLGDTAADVDLAQTLQALDLKTVIAPTSTLHELRPAADRRGFSYGRSFERLFWRHYAEASPAWALLCHALLVMGEALSRLPKGDSLTTLLGRAVGCLHAGATSSYRQALQQSREQLATVEEPGTLSLSAAREEREQTRQAPREQRRAA